MEPIRIKYFSDSIPPLNADAPTSDWIDLSLAEEVTLAAGEFRLLPLGVAMALPRGYEAHVVPRSSTFRNYGILQTNSCGVIDESYCGSDDQWFMPAYATRAVTIAQGARICQFRVFEHQPPVSFLPCDALEETNRGGFGTTGI